MDDYGRSGAGAPSGHSAEPEPSCTVSAVPASVPNAERLRIVAWLDRRADMCLANRPRWRPLRRRDLNRMAGTFSAAARLIERGAHLALTPESETMVIASAIEARRAETVKQGSVGNESAVAESDAPTRPNQGEQSR